MTGRSVRLQKRDARMAAMASEGKTALEIATAESIGVDLVYQWARRAGIKLARVGEVQKALKARILELAESGKSTDEIAQQLQVRPHAVYRVARTAGIPLRRSFKTKTDPEREARRAKMAEMYRQGITLAKIAAQFGMTRERVRQIISVAGMSRGNGGARVVADARKKSLELAREAKCLAEYGLPYAVIRQLKRDRVMVAYRSQKKSAAMRGIKFNLTFAQWFAVWQASGKLHLRGRGKGKYVMSRMSDDGGYELGNVHIQLATENSKEAVAKWRGKTKPNRGVFCLYPGRELAWLAKVGETSLGFYRTEAEAVAARDAHFETNPQRIRKGRGYAICRGKNGKPDRYQVMVGKKYVGSYSTPEAALAARSAYLETLTQPAPAEERSDGNFSVRVHGVHCLARH